MSDNKIKLIAYGVLAIAYTTLWYQLYKKGNKA